MIKCDGGLVTTSSCSTANKTSRMFTAIDLSRYVQVGDSDTPNLGKEGCKSVAATLNIDIDRMTVTV